MNIELNVTKSELADTTAVLFRVAAMIAEKTFPDASSESQSIGTAKSRVSPKRKKSPSKLVISTKPLTT